MKILAAVDLSGASGRILDAVKWVAEPTRAEVILLHIRVPVAGYVSFESHPASEDDALAQRYARENEQLEEMVDQLRDAGIIASALLLEGDPVTVTLQEAGRLEAGLIVTGSHGHGAVFDALMGSISSGILRKSDIPVLVVPVRGM
jgi:nucleotide-binding universal stress UspA family protein